MVHRERWETAKSEKWREGVGGLLRVLGIRRLQKLPLDVKAWQ